MPKFLFFFSTLTVFPEEKLIFLLISTFRFSAIAPPLLLSNKHQRFQFRSQVQTQSWVYNLGLEYQNENPDFFYIELGLPIQSTFQDEKKYDFWFLLPLSNANVSQLISVLTIRVLVRYVL